MVVEHVTNALSTKIPSVLNPSKRNTPLINQLSDAFLAE